MKHVSIEIHMNKHQLYYSYLLRELETAVRLMRGNGEFSAKDSPMKIKYMVVQHEMNSSPINENLIPKVCIVLLCGCVNICF